IGPSTYVYDVRTARVSAGGVVLDPSGIALAPNSYAESDPAVAYDGTNFMVVWTDSRNNASDIYGARVAPDGSVIDSTNIAVTTAGFARMSPAIAFDGVNYFVVWRQFNAFYSGDISGKLISPAGQVLTPTDI